MRESPTRRRQRLGAPARYLVGLFVGAGVVALSTLAARSGRPATAGDGVSFTPLWVLATVLSFVLIVVLLLVASSLSRRATPTSRAGGGLRVAAVGLVLLLVALVVLPRLAGGDLPEMGGGDGPMPVEVDDGVREPGQITSSPTAVGAGVLALVLAGLAIALALRPPGGRRGAVPAAPSPPADDRSEPTPSDEISIDPDGDPHAVVLAAYEAGRRHVTGVLQAPATDGPLALLRRVRRTPGAGPFDELTRAYLPVRFGVVTADEARRDASVAALARLRSALEG